VLRRLVPIAVALVALVCAPAGAAIELGVQDDPLLVRLPSAFGGFGAARLLPPAKVGAALDALGVDTVRINVPWARVAGARARDPLALAQYDDAVNAIRASGRRVQLTLSGPAPAWATGDRKVSTYEPDPRRYATFAGAVARHFAGRVARYSIWNEPNWWNLLRPHRFAARIYRALFLRGAAAVRAADPGAAVLFGELAPLARARASTAPLAFLRRVTCSDRAWRATRRCPRLVADGFAHHPYTLYWVPENPGPTRDDVTTGSLGRLTSALVRLARRGALATPARRPLPLYLTEWGYHAPSAFVPARLRAAYVRRGLALVARAPGVREIVWYQLAAPPPTVHAHWDSGLLDFRGRPRPAFAAVRAWSLARPKRPRPVVLSP
jgi:hypothetical protein